MRRNRLSCVAHIGAQRPQVPVVCWRFLRSDAGAPRCAWVSKTIERRRGPYNFILPKRRPPRVCAVHALPLDNESSVMSLARPNFWALDIPRHR
jgi:hypothetical protein